MSAARARPIHRPRPVHAAAPVLAWADLPVVCTSADVGRVLQCTVEKVQRMAAAGELPAFRLGPEWRFRREDLEAYIQNLIAPKEVTA